MVVGIADDGWSDPLSFTERTLRTAVYGDVDVYVHVDGNEQPQFP